MSQQRGKAIKVSKYLGAYMDNKRGKESFDALLRRVFGLPARKDTGGENSNQLRELWLVGNVVAYSEAEAKGEAILQMVRKGIKKADKPIKFRECA